MPRQRQVPKEVELVASRLGDLRERVVFIGGAIVDLLLTDAAAPPVRVTDDVDAIAQVISLVDYYDFEEQLRSLAA